MMQNPLPKRYNGEWKTIRGYESLFSGMALYHTERDQFYSVFSVENYTVRLHNLSVSGSSGNTTKQKQKIECTLYDKWVPVEVLP